MASSIGWTNLPTTAWSAPSQLVLSQPPSAAGDPAGTGSAITQAGAGVANAVGAAAQPDFPFTVGITDAASLLGAGVISPTQETEILQDATAAAADWGQYISGAAPLRVAIDIAPLSGDYLSTGGATTDVVAGQLDGRTLMEPSSEYALTTGQYAAGSTSDITITLNQADLSEFYLNPDPGTPGTVPANEYDLTTLILHEMGHGLGISGYISSTGALGSQETMWDHDVQENPDGTADFVGPNAEAVYGGPVPLTTLNNGEQYYHFANSYSDPDSHDLMSGLGIPPGTSIGISTLDLAVLKDVGEPVTAALPGAVVCFARGTRIAGLAGNVPVEHLAVGDMVLTARGEPQPIIWIGHRHLDCTRHPHPRAVWPVRIRAGAFAPELPARDLLVSPQHAIFAEGVLIPIKRLVNGRSVVQEQRATIEYFHIELPRHDILLAEGLPTESYLDTGDRACFDNAGGTVVLHPDFSRWAWDAGACAELRVVGPEVEAARATLARRLRAGPGNVLDAPAAARP